MKTENIERSLLKNNKGNTNYVILDIETTGLSCSENSIIEIAAIKVKNGKISDKFESLINPGCTIPPFITNLTGISNSMVCSAPCVNDVLEKFVCFVENLPLIAHNASFDMRFIHHNLSKCGLEINNEVIDTLKLSRQLYPHFPSHKLGIVADNLGVKVQNAHRAMADVDILHNVFDIMVCDIEKNSINTKQNINSIYC